MAMMLGGAKRGKRGLSRGGLMSDINVTPMVDVMLVLLKTTAKAMSIESKPITVTVRPDGTTFLGEDQIDPATLLASVNAAAEGNLEQRLYIRGDATADYGLIMDVMGTLSGAGYAHIGLITEQKKAP